MESKTINYNGVIITPIYKEMLVWDIDERLAKKAFVKDRTQGERITYEYSVVINGDIYAYKHVKEIESETKSRTIEDGLEYGELVVSSEGERHKVLGVCGEMVFLSSFDDFDRAGLHLTLKQLIKYKYKLYTEENEKPKTISIQEAQELLKSHGVNNIEIK